MLGDSLVIRSFRASIGVLIGSGAQAFVYSVVSGMRYVFEQKQTIILSHLIGLL